MDPKTTTTTGNGNSGEPDPKKQRGNSPAMKYVIAIDIETIGDFIEVPQGSTSLKPSSMISIGMVVVDVKTGKVLEKNRICLKVEEGHDFEPRCYEDFWNKEDPVGSGKRPNMENIKKFQAEEVPTKEGMQAFVDWLDKQEETYAGASVWGDCLSFDHGWLTVYMQRYLGRRSMLYRIGRKWRPSRCTGSYARGLTRWHGEPSKEMWKRLADMIPDLPEESIHDHMPDNDAQYIGQQAAAMLRYSARNPL